MTAFDAHGHRLDEYDRHVRFWLPDAILSMDDEARVDGLWMSEEDGDANRAVMMQHPVAGSFLRSLLPVRLTGGYMMTFGVWVALSADDLDRAFEVWWAPEYPHLRLTGTLANTVNPWGLLGVPVGLAVREPDSTPYCVDSTDEVMRRVLDDQWPHSEVLAARQG